jgi:hypothetical protein
MRKEVPDGAVARPHPAGREARVVVRMRLRQSVADLLRIRCAVESSSIARRTLATATIEVASYSPRA